jgi:glycosyltransferase involved in cell wall biosynthesis
MDDHRVVHIPRVLYTHQDFPPRPYTLPQPYLRALRHHGERLGLDPLRTNATKGPRFLAPTTDLVSIVIPTAGRATLIHGRATYFVQHCVESIRRLTTYRRYEIIVVDNGDLSQELAAELDALGVHRVTYWEPFNLAAKINLGARQARGEYLLLLNDDTEVISPDWLESLLEYAARPKIGAVGAKLYFPDGRLQHVGVILLDGNPSHPWYAAPGSHEGYFRSTVFPRNYLAVTGACLMTRRDVFERVGGFDPQFPLNYNDVDYCLRLGNLGLRCVWTPHPELYHHEAVSKEGGASVQPWELERFKARWGNRYPVDPFYSPNLSPRHCDYRLRAIGIEFV